MKELSQFDKQCFETAISIARKTYKAGDYPVGAVLAIDDKIIATGGNEFNLSRSIPVKKLNLEHLQHNCCIQQHKVSMSMVKRHNIL